MVVLAATTLPLLCGLFLAGLEMVGGEYIQFGVLMLAHSLAGAASWTAHYHTFGHRLLWLLACNLHALTYPVHWHLYANLVVADDDTLINLVVLGCIVFPSILVFGGPFNALIAQRRPAEG